MQEDGRARMRRRLGSGECCDARLHISAAERFGSRMPSEADWLHVNEGPATTEKVDPKTGSHIQQNAGLSACQDA
eukprot:2740702-Pleurochrysis_carterae.AAC.2